MLFIAGTLNAIVFFESIGAVFSGPHEGSKIRYFLDAVLVTGYLIWLSWGVASFVPRGKRGLVLLWNTTIVYTALTLLVTLTLFAFLSPWIAWSLLVLAFAVHSRGHDKELLDKARTETK